MERYDWGVTPPAVPGLDSESVARFFDADLTQIRLPTQSVRTAFGCNPLALDSDAYIEQVATKRAQLMSTFLRSVGMALGLPRADGAALSFEALAGDSHNGGRRPLLVHSASASGSQVLKFADPRPYLLLAAVLDEVSPAVGVDLRPPPITADPSHEWYLVPYLASRSLPYYELDQVMFSLGAVTAVAACLRMVDLHLENLLIVDGKPIIIDPECILHCFDGENPADWLKATGLIDREVHLSALRGGDVSRQPLFSCELRRRTDGVLDYRTPAKGFRNRVREPSTCHLADPADYREAVFAGYRLTHHFFVRHKGRIVELLAEMVDDDFRVRFLYRNTRHYAAVGQMLNLPTLFGSEFWRQGLFERFSHSASFQPRPSRKALAAEWKDLQVRDIPYFWVRAGETAIRHRSGVVQRLARRQTLKADAINSILSMSHDDLGAQLAVLNDFFDREPIAGEAKEHAA
jgi:hypothetical protein